MKIKELKTTYIVICKQDTGVKVYEGPFSETPRQLKNKEIVYVKNNYCEIK